MFFNLLIIVLLQLQILRFTRHLFLKNYLILSFLLQI